MLFKSQAGEYADDFGLELNEHTVSRDKLRYLAKRGLYPKTRTVYFYDGELQKVAALEMSPVVRINVLWMAKDLKLKCGVASTIKQKKQGLQGKQLDKNEGLFFPYAGPTDVVFHQGSVNYPLDIMFMRNNQIVKIEADTEVGGTNKWACSACDNVIETQGGFCFENNVNVGDKLVYFAVSQQDEIDLRKEREASMGFMSLVAELI
jgi:uncharacterized membrane protein (UPF0127 family)